MSTSLFLIALSMILGTILIMAGLAVFGRIRQAEAKGAGEEALHRIAAEATAAQVAAADGLAVVRAELTGLNTRLSAVEQMLKDVG